MDILGFALYHENVSPHTSKDETNKREVTDDEEIGNEPKRARLDLKSRVWEQIVQGDGEVPVDSICLDVQDREVVMGAVQQLIKEDRIMVEDGVIFSTL
mmetsp:Transcript_23884/g.55716  ORF Transcript_23884/g.55716 Transcript_23884/m.55716 type:complete len:99 (-) Transcript_23884:839-1135(-)